MLFFTVTGLCYNNVNVQEIILQRHSLKIHCAFMKKVMYMVCKIAVCDDSAADTELLLHLIAEWSEKAGISAQIESFPSAEGFLFRYAEDKSFGILLLDIEMGKINGVELAKQVRAENREVQIVFITGYIDYIADGYDVEALNYLMKPVSREKLFTALSRAVEKLREGERALFLEVQGESIRIPLREISYLESRKNYVTVHCRVPVTVKRSLSSFGDELDDGFFRAGRSYIVNLHFIRKVTKSTIFLKTGENIPLPRGMYKPLNRAIIRYF